MKHLKTFEDYKFKSDEDIQDEYSNFELETVEFDKRKLSNKSFGYESLFQWEFKGEEGEEDEEQTVIGGFRSSVEYVPHTITPDENGKCYFNYKTEHWYPESVYNKMIEIIKEKLKEKYNCEFEHLDFLEFHDKIDDMEIKKTDKDIEEYKKNKK